MRAWLAAHHAQTGGVWLVTFKAATPDQHVPWTDVVQECLCWGWVDSLPRKVDELRTMLWIAPRRAGSNWSAVNKAHVAALTAAGLMTPAGLAAADRARADGTWDALNGVDALDVPDDLARALATATGARATWDGFPPSVRRGVLEILLNTKRAETRAAKVAQVLESVTKGERPFQWRKS